MISILVTEGVGILDLWIKPLPALCFLRSCLRMKKSKPKAFWNAPIGSLLWGRVSFRACDFPRKGCISHCKCICRFQIFQDMYGPKLWDFNYLLILFCFKDGSKRNFRGAQEGERAGMIDGHGKSWQICSQYCLSRSACLTKGVSATTWSLILQEWASELGEGAPVKCLSWLIGKITPDEWGRLTVLHCCETLGCLTRMIQAPTATGFNFSLIRKATGRKKPKERRKALFQIYPCL